MSYSVLILRRAQKELADIPSEAYEIDDATQAVTVLHVGHRRDVYR